MARDRSTRWQYDLTDEELHAVRTARSCALCGVGFSGTGLEPLARVVDHNHRTGKRRGVIHQRCNIAIGMFKEDVVLLRAAIAYIERDGD